MHRTRALLAGLALAAAAVLPACSRDAEPETKAGAEPTLAVADTGWNSFCADLAKKGQLCDKIPHEVIVQLLAGYTGLNAKDQKEFDVFSWQSFIALNWPATRDGRPLPVTVGDSLGAPRVWESYRDAADVFGTGESGACSAGPGGKLLGQIAKNGHVVDPDGDYDEAVGGPLIDRNLNYVVFEKKMNPDEVAYVMFNRLNTVTGQEAADTIDFPMGRYDIDSTRTGGIVGAMEIKAAWRVLDPAKGDDTTRFYHRRATIYVPARNSSTGADLCLRDVLLGLVGMHIVHKTENFREWVWSTFEHVDNAPDCPAGTAQCGQDGRRYSFFNAACTTCALNDSASLVQGDTTFLWNPAPPYASRYAVDGQYGAQLARVVPLYVPTDTVNAVWRQKLQGTVWSNYRLIGSQWLSGETVHKPAPDTLGNTTLESFIPTTSSCLGCHQYAETAGSPQKFADFSFLLSSAGETNTVLPRFSTQGVRTRTGERHPVTGPLRLRLPPRQLPDSASAAAAPR